MPALQFLCAMAVKIASLNSGSNGNCYYIENDNAAILVDAGLSLKKISQRLTELALSWEKIFAIIITHEHSDHISGLKTICKKYEIPIYASEGTLRHIKEYMAPHCLHKLALHVPVAISEFTVNAFSKNHDASDPISLTLSYDDTVIGIFTDIGKPCKQTHMHFKNCNAAFLEANYDEDMLANSRYPYFLKQRISGGKGHLSNEQALEIFSKHRSPALSLLVLSHLSAENNEPALALMHFEKEAGKTKVVAASRTACTELFDITAADLPKKVPVPTQLSLF